MSKQLFKALLSKEFFNSISDDLPEEDFFPVELRSLYKVLVQAHLQYSGDITPDTLSDLFSIKYPTITPAAKLVVDATLNSLNELPEYNPSIANDIILTYKTQDIVRLAISKLLDVESNKASIEELLPLIDQYQAIEARLTTSVSEEVTLDEMVSLDDFENLLVEGDIEHKWKFNYPPLQGATNGLPESCFGIVAARPDVGKTAFYLSLSCNDKGFIHQGANVAVWRNEEAYTMVARRAISSLLDTPYEEAVLNVEAYHKKRSTIDGNVFILKDKVTGDKSIKDIDNYLKDHPEIDILIIDQLDGVLYKGQRAGDDVGILGALYTEARAIAARRNVAIIAITQAGAEAEGKLYYGLNGLYGSKTNKQATADFIFCLGAMPVQQGEQDSGVRAINFAKNKLKGPHKPIIYTLQHNVSRIGA